MTEREFRVWKRHLEKQRENPSLTDYYLMQIAALVYTKLSGQACGVEDMRLNWVVENPVSEMTEEQKKELARQISEEGRARIAAMSRKRNPEG